MVNKEWNIEFMHEYCEANKCADALAKIGCSLEQNVTFFKECPNGVKAILLADELGIVSPRI
ncbi:ribonuclease H, partial [Trifolium medium]|nr:ribonuclease H [Trifolium medium]